MKVHFKALGCRLNEAELEQWAINFQSRGFSITPEANDADLMVLNTCAVTQGASRKSRNLINRLHRNNPTAKLVVTGCHAALNQQEVASTLGVDLVIGNDQKNDLPDIIKTRLDLPGMPFAATEPGEIALYQRGRHRTFIKIQDGCRYRCTYCIVTIARGEENSRNIGDIVNEINSLTESGITEAVLTGVHVGGYGSDSGDSLASLIQSILEQTDLQRLRLASVEPWDLSDEFIDLFSNTRLMPHMHLPLQSGADSVLRRMSRRCRQADFLSLAEKTRSVVEHFNITTDIIAGFPGETEQEWQQTIDFVQTIGFGHCHIFPFSPREGTKAAALPDQIGIDIKRLRCKQLAEVAEQMKRDKINESIGRNSLILWEKARQSESTKNVIFTGYTDNFLRAEVSVAETENLDGCITNCAITGIDDSAQLLQVSLLSD